MNPYKECLSYGVDQTTFSSSKNLSKCREIQIFKFKQRELSGDYNDDEKQSYKRYKNVQNMFSDKTLLAKDRGTTPQILDGGGGGGDIRNRGEQSITNKGC